MILTSDSFLLLQWSCKLFDLEKPRCLQESPHALLRRDIVSFHSHKAIWLASWMCAAPNDGMQGVFPNRGAHFNAATYNHSCYSWIPSSFSMTDFHEQQRWLPLFFRGGIWRVFSVMWKKAGTQPDSDGSVISGVSVISWVLGLPFKDNQLTLSRYPTAHPWEELCRCVVSSIGCFQISWRRQKCTFCSSKAWI